MGGEKRRHSAFAMDAPNDTTSDANAALSSTSQPPQIASMFDRFRAELDEHHDRRERVIKASRDITAASKKM